MRKLIASVLAALPLAGAAQAGSGQPPPSQPAPPAQPAPAPPVTPPPAPIPPHMTPAPAPAAQYPPPQYAPPPQAPPQPQQPGEYPPPQYPPPGHYPYPPPGYYPYPPPQGYPPPPHEAPYPPPQPLPKQRAPYQRDGWYIGFQLGGGDARVRLRDRNAARKPPVQGGTYSLRKLLNGSPTTFDVDFQVGVTLTPRLIFGGQFKAFGATADSHTDAGKITNDFSEVSLNALATFFPWERGFFVRGGVGVAAAAAEFEDVPGYGGVKEKGTGVNASAGLGWAFWLGKSFNLTANVDVTGQAYGGDYFKSSGIATLGLGFQWY